MANDEGGYDVVTLNADGTASTQATISAPWATDAMGRSLTTSYTLNGTTLTQHIDTTGAVSPVVADPKITWGWTTYTVYFNKSETAYTAVGGQVVSYIPTPWTNSGGRSLVAWAGIAMAQRKCIESKFNYWSPIPSPSIYSGGYCTW